MSRVSKYINYKICAISKVINYIYYAHDLQMNDTYEFDKSLSK